jgi:3-oxoacyl-[acyl-carrier protein] reductase
MSKQVLLTGASRGLGKAIAIELARQGFTLVLNARGRSDALEETLEDVINASSEGVSPRVLLFDIGDRESCAETIAGDIATFGAYYGAVLNAGVADDAAFASMTDQQWDAVVGTNLGGFYNVLTQIVPSLLASRQKGRIVTLSSISGILGNQGQVNYSASKAGIIGATKALSRELARKGTTVNCVAPGLIKTEMTEDLPLEKIMQAIPMRRLGKPEEVAGVVSFLFSESASYVTGQVISVNGGMV